MQTGADIICNMAAVNVRVNNPTEQPSDNITRIIT